MPGIGSIKDQVENAFRVHQIGMVYLGVTGTRYQFPTGTVSMVCVKASPNNTGVIYIDVNNPVLQAPGTVNNKDVGWPLNKGDQTLWFMINNLNEITALTLNAGDKVFYWVMD